MQFRVESRVPRGPLDERIGLFSLPRLQCLNGSLMFQRELRHGVVIGRGVKLQSVFQLGG